MTRLAANYGFFPTRLVMKLIHLLTYLIVVWFTNPLVAKTKRVPHLEVTSTKKEAIELFTEGYIQLYAYNFAEAEKQFRLAVEVDPKCSLCWWGIGISLKQQHIEKGEGFNANSLQTFKKAKQTLRTEKNWEENLKQNHAL